MGWKKLKEHYDIKHLVQVSTRREYDQKQCIFIGSPYISDIIVIRIEDGMRLKKEQMMKGAFEFTQKHNDACVLASECLRNHGWFNREHDFNDLFLYLSCVDELFAGKFSGKTKVIVIKED